MEELSIKIKIADREYPMKVDAEDEERIRLAGKKINEKTFFPRPLPHIVDFSGHARWSGLRIFFSQHRLFLGSV